MGDPSGNAIFDVLLEFQIGKSFVLGKRSKCYSASAL